MPDIGITITGDREVELKFDQFPQAVHEKLRAAITTLTEELLARVIAAEPKRTGKLASETVSSVRDDEDRIIGRVSISAEYGKAAALEYGAHGTTKVQAHMSRLDHIFSRFVAPFAVSVSAYSRQVNIAQVSFLRKPLDAMQTEALESMRAALTDAVNES